MSTASATAQAQYGAIDIKLFRHPIEFLFREHDRQRMICATLMLLEQYQRTLNHFRDSLEA